MKSDLLIQEYILPYCNLTFTSNNPPSAVDKYLEQLNTNPETMVIVTAWLTSLEILPQRVVCISLYVCDIIYSC
jgi:hypothetical protein